MELKIKGKPINEQKWVTKKFKKYKKNKFVSKQCFGDNNSTIMYRILLFSTKHVNNKRTGHKFYSRLVYYICTT